VLSIAVPAFLRFEPQRGEEEFGIPIIFFGLLGVALLSVGAWRATRAIWETRRLVREWNDSSVTADQAAGWPALSTVADAPPLVVAGLIRPRLYVSSSAANVLSQDELARAIAHESAHVQRHDNLKKFFLRLCCIPSTATLERQWLAAVEIAADMDAVHSRREALDLASALVKASKIASSFPDLAMTFTAADGGQLLRTRVERLLSWDDSSGKRSSRKLVLTLSLFAVSAVFTVPWYSTILLAVHQLSEILVR
jgi:beta-lactamase regulating signal transducer with metallopeptidase domain